MHESTRSALVKTVTWGVIFPLGLFLVLIHTLTNAWATRLAEVYTVPLVIAGFGLMFLVQSLKEQQKDVVGTRR
jgi:hypothetical protein